MSSVVLLDPVEDQRWDKFVESHPNGLIYHLSGWKQVLERSFPHIKGFFPVIMRRATGEIRAGLPVYLVSSPITGRRLVSIPFATLCDPLVSVPEDIQVLTEVIIQLARHCGANRIEIRTLASDCLVGNPRFEKIDFFKHHYLILDEPPEQLAKRFHKRNVQPRIKRCRQSGLELSLDCSCSGVERFYDAFLSTRKRLGLPPQPYRLFKHIWQEFGPTGKLYILAAIYRGIPVASMMLFAFKDRVCWELIGEHLDHRHLNPTYFLLWQAIRLAQEQGYRILDFGRTSPNNLGLIDFKQRWGTVVGELPQYWYPCTGRGRDVLASTEHSMKYRLIQYLSRKSPKSLLPYIGELCYRHMG